MRLCVVRESTKVVLNMIYLVLFFVIYYYSDTLRLSRAWEWRSTEAGSASSVSDPADVIKGWKSVCFGSAGQLGVGRVEEQPPRGTVEVYGHWGQPLWLGKGLGEPRLLNDVE